MHAFTNTARLIRVAGAGATRPWPGLAVGQQRQGICIGCRHHTCLLYAALVLQAYLQVVAGHVIHNFSSEQLVVGQTGADVPYP